MPHKNYPVFIPHLACRNSCVFCDQHSIAGAQQAPSPQEVSAMLQQAEGGSNMQIAFFGGSFTGIEKPLMEEYLTVADVFVKKGKFSGIRLSTRPDYIDTEIMEILKRYRVDTIELGAQSMDDGVLTLSKRGHTSQQTVNAAQLVKSYGFELILQMMTGLPGADDAKDIYTAERIIGLKPSGVRIYPTVVICGTELDRMMKDGSYVPQTTEQAVRLCSRLILMFERSNITILKVGLHSQASLVPQITGGAFHPAFRELCESRIYFDILEKNLCADTHKCVIIECADGECSKLAGHKRSNITALAGTRRVKIIENSELVPRQIRVYGGSNEDNC